MSLEEGVKGSMTTQKMQKSVFVSVGIEKFINCEEFKEKGYYLYDVAQDWE